jgi:hypothetical protein
MKGITYEMIRCHHAIEDGDYVSAVRSSLRRFWLPDLQF